ncbi:MAG: hypothetical protein ACREFP_12485 [Acetobacteraceae bacterium]
MLSLNVVPSRSPSDPTVCAAGPPAENAAGPNAVSEGGIAHPGPIPGAIIIGTMIGGVPAIRVL